MSDHAVIAIETQPRCKICQSPRRTEIDALLLKRSLGESDENGRRFNLEYVLELIAELGVTKPNEQNVKVHWRKHCEVLQGEEAASRDVATLQMFEEVLGPDFRSRTPTNDEILELSRRMWLHDQLLRAQGKKPLFGMTHDHALKAVDSGTKRVKDEAQAELMQGLAIAISARTQVQLPAPAPVQAALPEPVEDAEVVDV